MTLAREAAVRATGGELRAAERFPADLRVVTDTRTLRPGDTFLALRGDRFNGHAYVRDALARGAAAVVVDEPDAAPAGVPALLVRDTKRAYMDLAGAAREAFAGRVIAVTGSAGKTTTKELLAQLLRAHFGADRVLASPANENNEIGVSHLLLRAGGEHAVVVVEMGARHFGEIAELVAVARPHVGILTNVGEAHLEVFGSRERLAQTKWGLFSGMALAVLNANDHVSRTRAPSLHAPPRWFGTGEPTLPGTYVVDEHTVALSDEPQPLRGAIDVRLPGAHNRANLAAALAGARALGIALQTLLPVLPTLALPPGRYERIHIAGRPPLIFDAYNANASGMIAALDAFARERGSRRIAVLGSMAELGEQAPGMHEQVGAHAARCADVLLVGGAHADSLSAGALAAGLSSERIVRFTTNAQAASWLRANAHEDDVVLLKGSRMYRLEEIVEDLRIP